MSQSWYLFDDHHVTQVPATSVVTKDAYILFYERRCERNAAATVRLQACVTSLAPSGDTSLSSIVNTSTVTDSTVCGVYDFSTSRPLIRPTYVRNF